MTECTCDPRLGDSCRCKVCHVWLVRDWNEVASPYYVEWEEN